MKTCRFILIALCSLLVFFVVDQYLFCPVYSFQSSTPFSGDSIYNPYASVKQSNWVKCNFHAHVHCWEGLTYGYGKADDIFRVYNRLHYGVHAVSNYQFIDTTLQSSLPYISSYEHGYNILKTHQLVLGARSVTWKDYLLPQTTSNKQDVINRIRKADSSAVIIINHPMVRNGYRAFNFEQLTQYNCMEVLNPACNSSVLWDAALTAGKPIFIVGDDDAHNFADTNRIGSICTWINVPGVNRNNIVKALKTGSSYAMRVGKRLMQQERQNNNDSMPMLQSFFVQNDALQATFSLPAKEITVWGKNGRVLKKVVNTDSVDFALGKQEPYARVVATYNNGTELYLNPVFRYKRTPLLQAAASINTAQTFLQRIAGFALLLFWLIFATRMLFKIKRFQMQNASAKKIRHEFITNDSASKDDKVWHRGRKRLVYRFFNYLAWQRKNQTE